MNVHRPRRVLLLARDATTSKVTHALTLRAGKERPKREREDIPVVQKNSENFAFFRAFLLFFVDRTR